MPLLGKFFKRMTGAQAGTHREEPEPAPENLTKEETERRRRLLQQQQRLNAIRRGQQHILFQYYPPHDTWILNRVASFPDLCRQSLPAWRPILSANPVGRLCLILSMFFVPVGVFLLLTGRSLVDLKVNYEEECTYSRNYLWILRECEFCGDGRRPTCWKEIDIPVDLKTPVFLYYEIEGFHFNHRKIVDSVDNRQLLGRIFNDKMEPVIPSSCKPLIQDQEGKIYFPCGSRANFMFTDDFSLTTAKGAEVPLRKHDIVQPRWKAYRFKNPPEINSKNYYMKKAFMTNFTKPKAWTMQFWDQWWRNGGLENERFVNWMVVSPFSTFRKLYGVVESVPHCPPGVFCKGTYNLQVEYRYDIDALNATKSLIISTVTSTGTRNILLSVVIIIDGVIFSGLGIWFIRYAEIQRRRGIKDGKKTTVPQASDTDSDKDNQVENVREQQTRNRKRMDANRIQKVTFSPEATTLVALT